MIEDWKDDLLREKSLWEAYGTSKALARSTFNKWAFRSSLGLLVLVGIVWEIRGEHEVSYSAVMSVADIAFDLTVQILGFLIGGFAIFATISDSHLMVRLAKTPMKRTGLSVFKTIFFNFISVFFIYVATLSLAVVIKVASTLQLFDLTFLPRRAEIVAVISINAVVFLFLGVAVTLSILRLKSFIWNIYQAYLTLLIVGEMADKSGKPSKP
jgi:hypothetical protein